MLCCSRTVDCGRHTAPTGADDRESMPVKDGAIVDDSDQYVVSTTFAMSFPCLRLRLSRGMRSEVTERYGPE